MDWKEAEHRLMHRLRQELRANLGRIGEIERRLGYKEGYLSKRCVQIDAPDAGLSVAWIRAQGVEHDA